MPPIERPGARSRRRRASLSVALGGALGCVEPAVVIDDDAVVAPACPEPPPLARALDAVVSLRVTRARGTESLTCSGVAIAPRLVLTALHCVMQPGAMAPLCDPREGWAPVETGDGSSRFGEPFDLANMSVYLGPEPPAIARGFARVREVIRSGATSRCVDDFALLVLDCPLDVEPVPVRLDARATRLGERLVLSGHGGQVFISPRRELEGEVLLVTGDDGDVRAPPRSLLLSAPACSFDHGGPVLSPETGALVGSVVTGTGSGCEDAEGNTVAVHLAPFRELLVAAAERTGTSLRSEREAVEGTPARECQAPVATAAGDAGPRCATR